MSLLTAAFREQVKKTKDIAQQSEMTYSTSYSTGFLSLDFANGYVQQINGKPKFELGFSDGSINMIISDSGLGKTTLTGQMACNMIRQFPNSAIFYEQAEIGTNLERIRRLSGFTEEEFERRFIIRDAGITIESIYERIRMIHDIKVNNKDDYIYDTGMCDYHGKAIYKFTPTVVIVDSVSMVMSRKNADTDEMTNLSGAQQAKANSEYFKKMVPLCRIANIIMILINHITTDINTGFLPKKPELPYLKVGEHLSGSRALVYICNTILRIDMKTKLKEGEGFNIIGSVVNVDVVKSRTNKTSRARCSLVFDQDSGFDPDLSLFLMLKENNLLEGSGAYLKVPGCDTKFSQKTFKEQLYSDPNLYKAFIITCRDYLKKTLMDEYYKSKVEEERKSDMRSPYQAILDSLYDDNVVTETYDNNDE